MAQNGTVALPIHSKPKEFGSVLKAEFPFDPEYTPLNHGSFGSIPKTILAKLRQFQDDCESHPDQFIFYEYPGLLDESREAVSGVLNVPVETVVFVSNATDGVNTVFRNIAWNEDGKDVVITFSTVYEACGKVVDYLEDYYGGKVSGREIQLQYPLEDEEIVSKFRETVKDIEAQGKRARVAIFDVVSSRPGVVFPYQDIINACKDLGVLSMLDGAQGIGMVPLDLSAADPDFFVSNCHKWLFAPRGCAVFYVPLRNQALLPTTLATSHGYIPKTNKRTTPMPPTSKSAFVNNFEFVGTKDNGPYLCVKHAIAYRRDVLGGEDRIIKYIWDLSKKGSKYVAEQLGTEVLDNKKGTLTNCPMANIALPVWVGEKGAVANSGDVVVPVEDADLAFQWFKKTLVDEYKTFMNMFILGGRFWVRISAQIYLGMEDYEFAVKTLKDMTERVGKKDYLKN